MPRTNQLHAPKPALNRTCPPKSQRSKVASKAACSVLMYKTALMQRIADHVRLGYKFWTAGTVEPNRAQVLVDKFAHLYDTNLSRHQKAYARILGQASATLLLWSPTSERTFADPLPTSDHTLPTSDGSEQTTANSEMTSPKRPQTSPKLHWFLLITPGEHLTHRLETLRDASTLQGRIELTGYELVTLPRVGQSKPAWTWRMTATTYTAWRQRLISAARRHLNGLNRELQVLTRTPGFAGCRVQVKKLLQLARAEASRRMSAEQVGNVTFPTRVPYLQRVPQGGVPISRVQQLQQALRESPVCV